MAHAQAIRTDLPFTNLDVYATALSSTGDTLYLGGAFTSVDPHTGSGAAVDTVTGQLQGNILRVEGGNVVAVVSDGSGGWYVGGSFTTVNGVARSRLAHILSNGTLSSWDPNANGQVWALAVSGSTVYVGGDFGSVGGQSRSRIAALDASTGFATTWASGANTTVTSLAVSGSILYVGGSFNAIGGQTRNRIAALDAVTGVTIGWNPNANDVVYALTVSGSTVYAGGAFNSIGGQSRHKLAALSAASGFATSWNPDAGSGALEVRALAVSGFTVYAAGFFTTIGGQTRNRIAAIDVTTGSPTAWNPNGNSTVFTLAVSGSTVYAGGTFTNIGGQARNRVAALNAAGIATAWNPNATGPVIAMAVSGPAVYAGGSFTSIGRVPRNQIASVDLATGQITSWNPNADGSVSALAVSGATVYAGGNFTGIGGQTRAYIAALNATTGNATAWNPNANGTVNALTVRGTLVYAGGNFYTIGGQTRAYIAALDATTGNATSWNPDGNSTVFTLAVSGSTVYAGGSFNAMGGQARNRIAALDATTGIATPWNPNGNSTVFTLAVSGSTVYAGGGFTTIGGEARNRIAALDVGSGNATAWNPNADSSVRALTAVGTTVYAGGSFTAIGGQLRNRLAALDATGGNALGWNPAPINDVYSLSAGGSTVYVGGLFQIIGGLSFGYFAGIEALPAWTDATTGPLGDTGSGRGVAWGDYDGDGDLDLYLANLSPANHLFRNGSFTDVTADPLGNNPGSHGVAWGDYDCDHDLDLFVSRDGTCRLFRNDGGDAFADVSSPGAIGATDGFWRGVAWLDVEGDGDLDVFVANENGTAGNKLFRNDAGTFVDGTGGVLAAPGPAFAVAPGDYDNDGDTDLYVTYAEAANKLFRNDAGTWVDVTSGPLGDAGNGASASWGDYDNDRDLDLYLSNLGGANKLFRNDGSGTFVDVTSAPLGGPTASMGTAWGDVDNDGDLDLYVVASGESSRYYRNDGGGVFRDWTSGGIAGVTDGRGVALADYDADGDLDLYISQHNAANLLLRNDLASAANWLHVDLVGGRGNSSAIGERVRVVTGTTSQIREIEGGMGYLSQNSLTAEFGLGSATHADTVEVRWRSGRVSRLLNVPAPERITVTEPGVLRVPSGYPTIQAAITAAMSGDTVLVAVGTYTGAGNRDLDFGGKNLLLAYEGMVPGPWCGPESSDEAGHVILDCEGLGRGMSFHSGETSASVVRGLSFVNGYTTANGGGVFISGGSDPVFERCLFTGNYAPVRGGAIHISGGSTSPSFVSCTISGNHSSDRGGGINGQPPGATASFTRCIVWGNCAEILGDEIFLGSGVSASFTCSDLDVSGVSGSPTYVGGNIFTNPRFCEQASCFGAPGTEGVLTLASDSPCLPANNGCGQLMGALGQGCVSATQAWIGEGDGTTWQDAANWSDGVPVSGDDVVIEDLPVTSEVVYDESFAAGLLPVGEALAVALDTLTSGEPLRMAQGTLQVTGAASVDTLVLQPGATLGGTGTVTVGVLKWRGGLMTDAGTTRVTSAMTLSTISDKSLRGGRLLESEGAWTWPGAGVLKEGDGALGTRIRNEGTLTVAGERMVDHEPLWGTTALFENVGTSVQTVNSTLTVEAAFTNTGTIDVAAGTVDLVGGLTNFSGTTLTGGTYDVSGTLRFPGADLRTNAGVIVLDGPVSSIVDGADVSALTLFGSNGGVGDFTITNGRDLTVPAGFTNAGQLTVGPASTFTINGAYSQSGTGTTSGSGTVNATTMVNSGTLRPGSALGIMSVDANYQQTATGELEIEVGGYVPGTQYDVLAIAGTAQIGGRLRLELVPPFDPNVNDAFQFLTASSVTGTFSEVKAFSIGSHVNYGATSATAVVDSKHSRFTGGSGSSWFNAANWTNGMPTALQDVLVNSSVVIDGGTAVAREVRVIGGGGNLVIQNGGIDCDTLRVRSGGILSLTQQPSKAQANTLRLEQGAGFGWANGRVVVDGGRLEKADAGFTVGDSPDTSFLELRDGAVMNVPGTLWIGRDFGDRGWVVVEGSTLNVGAVEVGMVGTGVLEVLEGGVVNPGLGGTLAPRTTVGAQGTLLGVGTVNGQVTNQGLVSPGSVRASQTSTAGIGTLHIAGSYDQDPGGVLELEVAGTGTGGWDSLLVAGQAQLEGKVRVVRNLALAFLPDTAEVVRYGTRQGTFGVLEMRAFSPGDAITATPAYGGTALRLALAGTLSVVGLEPPPAPRLFRVYPNFPNPFRSATTIQFDLPARADVKLRIYDLQGRLVRTLLDSELMEAGTHRRMWAGENEQGQRSASGVYFYRLDAGRDRQIRRMVKLE